MEARKERMRKGGREGAREGGKKLYVTCFTINAVPNTLIGIHN